MADETHVKGLAQLQEFLDKLTPKMEANVMRGGLRAGTKVVQPVAKASIRSRSGLLAAGLSIGSRIRGRTVMAYLAAKGKHWYIARWLEYGTKAHIIKAPPGSSLSFGGIFTAFVQHPGIQPKPFMRPSLDKMAAPAVVAVAEYIKKRLATKEGLDTSHVLIEGDEP